jgi:rSAM/selenodomain-associated transferase 1
LSFNLLGKVHSGVKPPQSKEQTDLAMSQTNRVNQPIPIVLFTRLGCHLCEQAETVLAKYETRFALVIAKVDIDGYPELQAKYGECVPVVAIRGRERFRGQVNEVLLVRELAMAGERFSDRVLGVFAKAPRLGNVKSRLAATIGHEQAARLYDAFLRDLRMRLTAVDASRVLVFAEPDDRAYFAALCGDQFELQCQAGGDLGERMSHFFAGQFDRGACKVVLIGSDSPDLPVHRISQAFQQLDDSDVVLGPCDDGGYYLIGMRRLVDGLLSCIEWSSSTVLAETIRRLRDRSVRFTLLESWYDVDVASDLDRLVQRVRAARDQASDLGIPRTEVVLQALRR